MTSLMDKVLKKPCIQYKLKFIALELEKVKLRQSYDDGTSAEKKCPIFSGKEGIEGLLYVEEKFLEIARHLNYDTGVELYDRFEEVLTDTTEEHWKTLLTK